MLFQNVRTKKHTHTRDTNASLFSSLLNRDKSKFMILAVLNDDQRKTTWSVCAV